MLEPNESWLGKYSQTWLTIDFYGLTTEYPATWVNLFLHISGSLKICAQVESSTIVAGYSAVAPF